MLGIFKATTLAKRAVDNIFFDISQHLKRCNAFDVWFGEINLFANLNLSIYVALEGSYLTEI